VAGKAGVFWQCTRNGCSAPYRCHGRWCRNSKICNKHPTLERHEHFLFTTALFDDRGVTLRADFWVMWSLVLAIMLNLEGTQH
jgi:hypothetical protein